MSSTELHSSDGGKIGLIAVLTRSCARSDSNRLAKSSLPVRILISTERSPFQWTESGFALLNYPPVMVGRLDQL